jgi:hypothetical protein
VLHFIALHHRQLALGDAVATCTANDTTLPAWARPAGLRLLLPAAMINHYYFSTLKER